MLFALSAARLRVTNDLETEYRQRENRPVTEGYKNETDTTLIYPVFGSNGLPQARDKLFAWAYALRVQMARVQFASIDNRARGKDDAAASPFVLMRNAVTGQAIQRLTVREPVPYHAEHEKELRTFIQPTSTP